MTNLKRFIAIFLVAVMLFSFFACNKSAVEDETAAESNAADATEDVAENTDDSDKGDAVVFSPSDIEKFKIVYASDLGQAAMAEVRKLADRINSVHGVNITMTSDFIMSNDQMKEWDNEILIGKTNREESI